MILIYIKVPFWLWSKSGYSFKFSHIASFSSHFKISQAEQVAKLASPMGRYKALLYEVLEINLIVKVWNQLKKLESKSIFSNLMESPKINGLLRFHQMWEKLIQENATQTKSATLISNWLMTPISFLMRFQLSNYILFISLYCFFLVNCLIDQCQ